MRKTTPYGIRAIAEKLGISSSTVSRALNNNPRISQETRAKVMRLARELGRPMDKVDQRVILLILPSLHFQLTNYSFEIINEIRLECKKRGFFLEMIAADQLDILNNRDYMGAICCDFSSRVSRLWGKHYTIPLVMLNDYSNHIENIYTVSSDSRSAFTLAVRHLVKNNHHRIGMLQYQDTDNAYLCADNRQKAFFEVMNSFGIAGKAFVGTMNLRNSAFSEFHEILKNKITALIVCGEGVAACRTISFLNKNQIKVPEELAIITWESRDFSKLQIPPLTTVAQNFPELARQTFCVLESIMAGKSVKQDITIPYLFHDRDSVGKL